MEKITISQALNFANALEKNINKSVNTINEIIYELNHTAELYFTTATSKEKFQNKLDTSELAKKFQEHVDGILYKYTILESLKLNIMMSNEHMGVTSLLLKSSIYSKKLKSVSDIIATIIRYTPRDIVQDFETYQAQITPDNPVIRVEIPALEQENTNSLLKLKKEYANCVKTYGDDISSINHTAMISIEDEFLEVLMNLED